MDEQPKMKKTCERPRANNQKWEKHTSAHGRTTQNEKNMRSSTDEQLKMRKTCERPRAND